MGWTLAALVVSLAGSAGSLWLSIGMDLKACPLCLYQRSFILAVVGVLVVGLFSDARRTTGLLNALALPAATGGFGVALFHVYLEAVGRLECPAGLLGWGTAPQQSLAVFAGLLILLATPLLCRRAAGGLVPPAVGLVLGAAFAVGTIQSAPPMPSAPEKPYETPLEMCRPPHQSAGGASASP